MTKRPGHFIPTILPPAHTLTQPSSSFDSTSRGHCTWHTLISSPTTASASLSAGIAVCPPLTGSLCPHRHSHAEIYYVISGKGVMTIEGKEYVIEAGSTVFLPGDAEHGVVNEGTEDLRWFYVFAADSFGEVVYRFTHEEEEATKAVVQSESEVVGKGKKHGGGIWQKLKTILG